jgi:heterodisulfide reductase subunit A
MEMSQPSTGNGRQRKWGPRRRGPQRGELPRTGVYVCHCGINIAGTVDVAEVANFASGLPGVTVAREYSFTCSEPGQQMIADDIKNLGLERVVVAACSPRMHEPTFRRVMESAGLNPFYLQMTNIREQDSWVTKDRAAATYKAKQLVEAAVRRVVLQDALYARTEKVEPATLVIGGGIAGIQAALDIADAGYKVYLVEREPTIGGRMAQLNKTFPTLDCST